MRVALIDCRVRREEVQVTAATHIPYVYSLATLENHGKWVVVVGTVLMLEGDESRFFGGLRRDGRAHPPSVAAAAPR